MKLGNLFYVFVVLFGLELGQLQATSYPFGDDEEREIVEDFSKNFLIFRQRTLAFFSQGWERISSCFQGSLEVSAPVKFLTGVQNRFAASEEDQLKLVQWLSLGLLSLDRSSVAVEGAGLLRVENTVIAFSSSLTRFSTLALCKIFIDCAVSLEDKFFQDRPNPAAEQVKNRLKNVLRLVVTIALWFDLFMAERFLPFGEISAVDSSGMLQGLYFLAKFWFTGECLVHSGLLLGMYGHELYAKLSEFLKTTPVESANMIAVRALDECLNNRLLRVSHLPAGEYAQLAGLYPNLQGIISVEGRSDEEQWACQNNVAYVGLPLAFPEFPTKEVVRAILSIFDGVGDRLVLSDSASDASCMFVRALFSNVVARKSANDVIAGLDLATKTEEELARVGFFVEQWRGFARYNPQDLERRFQDMMAARGVPSLCEQPREVNEGVDQEVKNIFGTVDHATQADQNLVAPFDNNTDNNNGVFAEA